MTERSRLVHGCPIYYGWVIFVVAIIGMVMTSPGQTDSVSIFIEHFINDLGLSRSVVSTLYTVATLIASVSLPFIGRQIDRRGHRAMVGVITVAFALALVYMGQVRGAAMLGIGFVAIRTLGQGSLELVSTNLLNQWWVRRRGMIIGIAGVVGGPLAGTFPNLIHALISRYGWRFAYTALGLVVLVVMLPVGLIFFRNRPEEYGLLPDGIALPDSQVEGTPATLPEEEHWTSAEAVRTTAFWIIGLGGGCIAMLTTGLMFHMVSIFGDNGLAPSLAAAVFVPISAAGAVVGLGSGLLVDRVPMRFMMAASLLLEALALLMVSRLGGVPSAVVWGIILGMSNGLMRTVRGVAWPNYYGRRHLGAITGIAGTMLQAGSALGPMPFGIARDLLGSYNATLAVAAALPLVLSVASLFIRRPIKGGSERAPAAGS